MTDIFWIAIDKLTPNGRNARSHSRKPPTRVRERAGLPVSRLHAASVSCSSRVTDSIHPSRGYGKRARRMLGPFILNVTVELFRPAARIDPLS